MPAGGQARWQVDWQGVRVYSARLDGFIRLEAGHRTVIPVQFEDRSHGICGQVFPAPENSNREDLSGIRVAVRATDSVTTSRTYVETGADGSFQFENLRPGQYEVWLADHEQILPLEVPSGAQDVRLALPILRNVRIEVVDAVSGLPVPNARAYWFSGADWGMTGKWSQNHGQVILRNLGPSAHTVVVDHPEYVWTPISLQGRENNVEITLRAVLEKGRRIEIQIAEQEAAAHAEILLLWVNTPDGKPLPIAQYRGATHLTFPNVELLLRPLSEEGDVIGPDLVLPVGSSQTSLEIRLDSEAEF